MSLPEIMKRVPVARSTLSLWLRPYPLTEDELRARRSALRKNSEPKVVERRIPRGYDGCVPLLNKDKFFNPFDKRIVKLLGPYLIKCGSNNRWQVAVYFDDKTHATMLLSRWRMMQHLRRALVEDEHVDHINENPLDDRVENLQILTREENSRKSLLGKPSKLRGRELGWRHGTCYGWSKKRCQCDECLVAKKEWNSARNAARRESYASERGCGRGPYQRAAHGRMYKRGCRCDMCRDGHRQTQLIYRAKRRAES